jgi:hypothetical protein
VELSKSASDFVSEWQVRQGPGPGFRRFEFVQSSRAGPDHSRPPEGSARQGATVPAQRAVRGLSLEPPTPQLSAEEGASAHWCAALDTTNQLALLTLGLTWF